MRRRLGIILFASICCAKAVAQVIAPVELQDPKLQHLQQRHLQSLMAIGKEIEQEHFPYPFYFCRVLGLDPAKMQSADQRSIRFDIYQQETILALTGNYYASYSADRMDAEARLKQTFQQVIAPMLQVEVRHLPDDSEFSAFAFEVSHHVRRRIMGMSSEMPENVTVIIPVAAAQKFVDDKTDDERQAALLDASFFLNGEPRQLWLRDGSPPEDWKQANAPRVTARVQTVSTSSGSTGVSKAEATVSQELVKPRPARIITPEMLAGLQRQNQDAIDRILGTLAAQAHFLAYAPPTFVAFRQGSYLQLSMSTTLEAASNSSRYKLAALAFDEHISHLIRPVLDFFPSGVEFDGIDFSTTIHASGDPNGEAVEFFFPNRMLRCFAEYDCTGQQLLDSGTIVINGERAGLDLQIAEGKN